jgi:hypothetical protein
VTPATIRTGCHVAALDPLTGFGLIAGPAGPDVVLGPLSASLHWSDFEVMAARLDSLGWEVVEDDYGLPASAGRLSDGRPLVSVAALDPIDGHTDDERLMDVAHAVMVALLAA